MSQTCRRAKTWRWCSYYVCAQVCGAATCHLSCAKEETAPPYWNTGTSHKMRTECVILLIMTHLQTRSFLPWASPPLVSTAIAFPAPDRFSKNIFLLSGCAIFTAGRCTSQSNLIQTHKATTAGRKLCVNKWRATVVLPLWLCARCVLLLPVPHLGSICMNSRRVTWLTLM